MPSPRHETYRGVRGIDNEREKGSGSPSKENPQRATTEPSDGNER